MKIFYVSAEPLSAEGPPASAVVVAEDPEQALLLLRKDINFSGYRLPPAELTECPAAREDVRRVLGAAATHEIGVYGFTVLGTADSEDPGTPPAAA